MKNENVKQKCKGNGENRGPLQPLTCFTRLKFCRPQPHFTNTITIVRVRSRWGPGMQYARDRLESDLSRSVEFVSVSSWPLRRAFLDSFRTRVDRASTSSEKCLSVTYRHPTASARHARLCAVRSLHPSSSSVTLHPRVLASQCRALEPRRSSSASTSSWLEPSQCP